MCMSRRQSIPAGVSPQLEGRRPSGILDQGARHGRGNVVDTKRLSLTCVALACLATRGVCGLDMSPLRPAETRARALSIAARARMRGVADRRRPPVARRGRPVMPKTAAPAIGVGASGPVALASALPYRMLPASSALWASTPAHVSYPRVDMEAARAWTSSALANVRRPVLREPAATGGAEHVRRLQSARTPDGRRIRAQQRYGARGPVDIWRRRRRSTTRGAHA